MVLLALAELAALPPRESGFAAEPCFTDDPDAFFTDVPDVLGGNFFAFECDAVVLFFVGIKIPINH